MKTYKILQWGSKRSVVEYDGTIYLVDNDYLMYLDKWVNQMIRFNVGDVLVKKEKGQEPIHRKIIAVRDSGYSWIYVDDEKETEFYSEDSSDPFFEWKWVKVK